MENAAIAERQRVIVHEIAQINVMKKGSVTFQRLGGQNDGGESGRGLYPLLTWKEQGRTKSMRLKTREEVAWAQDAVENYKRFTALCREYESLAEQRALFEREGHGAAVSEAEKKRSKSHKKSRPK
jgi:hypothetical protein